MMVRLLLVFSFLLFPCLANATTINATSCSQSDVSSAISAASNGDTVMVPAGNCSWDTSSVTVPKAIILQGEGVDSTNITLAGGAVSVEAAATIRAFAFLNTSGVTLSFSGEGFRFTGNTWTTSDTSHTGQIYISAYGLVDNNTFEKGAGTNEMLFIRGPTDSWQTDSSMGGADNVFIENNTFTDSGYPDANSNARVVFRYNTITGAIKFDAHGKCTNTPHRSARHYEIYNNEWTVGTVNQRLMELRGGTGRVFNNTATTASQYILIRDYCSLYNTNLCWGYKETDGVDSCGCPSLVPLDDMIGIGKDPKARASEPLYLWNNTNFRFGIDSNTPTADCRAYCNETYGDSATFVMSDVIVANIDYFSSATKPEAMVSYTPYTCPHPFAGTGTCDSVTAGISGYSLSGETPAAGPFAPGSGKRTGGSMSGGSHF